MMAQYDVHGEEGTIRDGALEFDSTCVLPKSVKRRGKSGKFGKVAKLRK